MQRNIKFKKTVSPEYKDLVNSLLQVEPSKRLPLIKVFEHPWVINFQVKYNLEKEDFAPKSKTKGHEESKSFEQQEEEPVIVSMNDTSMMKSMLSELGQIAEREDSKKDLIMEEVESMLMHRRGKRRAVQEDGEEDVYAMCDAMMDDLS